ncbi:MAG: 30S ribosomal protein S6 [bacterium]|nr:30S ribosomal protein S6 [bacterium]
MAEIDIELEANQDEKREPRLYELGYHLLSILPEESVPEEVGKIKDLIEKLGGIIVTDHMPQTMSLAYPIPKIVSEKRKYFDTALFGWIKFKIEPFSALELQKNLRDNKNILRFIIIKTVEEKAPSPKKMTFLKPKEATRPKPATEKKKKSETLLSEEELEKTIEELVTK